MALDEIGSNSQIDIDYNDLQGFLDEMSGKKKAVDEATGSLRSALKETLDDTGWEKTAVAMIRRIAAMSETKRADFLRTFEPMFDIMLSKVWRDEMLDMFDDQTERVE